MEFSDKLTWFDKTYGKLPTYEALGEDLNVDVCLVGAGFVSVAVAYHLSAKGKTVALIEPGKIGFGCSGRTGAFIDQGIHAEYADISDIIGAGAAKTLWKECLKGRDELINIIGKNKLDCSLSTEGIVQSVLYSKNVSKLDRRSTSISAVSRDEVTYIGEDELQDYIASPAIIKAVSYQQNGTVDPLALFFALVNLCKKQGVKFFERTQVLNIDASAEKSKVTTSSGSVTCNNVVITGNAYMTDLDTPEKTRTLSTNFYQLVTKPLPDDLLKDIFKKASAMVDCRYLSEYIQPVDGNRILIGGADYMPKNNDVFTRQVLGRLAKIFPQIAELVDVDYIWRGPVGVPMNYMPVFEKTSDNTYITHGYNGHGVVLNFVAGKALAQSLEGDDELLESLAKIRHVEMPKFIHFGLAKLSLFYYMMRDRFLTKTIK